LVFEKPRSPQAGAVPLDADEIIRALGRRIAELRRRAGLTQAAFAERSGVSVKYVQRIEAGRENLTVRSLVSIAECLGTTPRELLEPPATLEVQRGRPGA
jgi:transcriptional regulator with XRE-family HTH domain